MKLGFCTDRNGLELAARAAALSVTRKGAVPSIPYLEEVLNFI